MHARGFAAKGYFELTDALEGISRAGVLNRVGEKTPVFVRFEVSKVDTKAVRERMVGQLANVDATIAQRVADGLGVMGTIKPVPTTVPARTI